MRTILIPGLGEDEFIFDRLKEFISEERLCLSLWRELPEAELRGLTVTAFAATLVERYQITAVDLVIGHSTGGWVALHIKQAVGCPIVQIASWTDPHKVIVPVRNRWLIYFAARAGLYLSESALRRSLKNYKETGGSRPVFEQVFRRLMTGSRANVLNQLRLIFNPAESVISVKPDLRIHALNDQVIRYPDERAHTVPGDHFTLYTHAAEVAAPIVDLLSNLRQQ